MNHQELQKALESLVEENGYRNTAEALASVASKKASGETSEYSKRFHENCADTFFRASDVLHRHAQTLAAIVADKGE